jgi:hypothetical protein
LKYEFIIIFIENRLFGGNWEKEPNSGIEKGKNWVQKKSNPKSYDKRANLGLSQI